MATGFQWFYQCFLFEHLGTSVLTSGILLLKLFCLSDANFFMIFKGIKILDIL